MTTGPIRIERLAYGGDAIAHDADGKTVFVAGGCPGDLVTVTVTTSRSGFDRGHITEMVEASPQRVEPACPYHAICGGCPWQHLSPEMQLAAKRTAVVDSLVRIAHMDAGQVEKLVAPTVPSAAQWGYRNKVEFTVSTQGRLSLGLHGSDGGIVPIDSCPLLPRHLAKAPRALSGALRYLCGEKDLGIFRVGVRTSQRTRSTEVALWTRPGAFPRGQAAKILGDAVPGAGITRVLAKGPEKERRVTGVEVLSGKGFWTERIAGGKMAVSAPSFFQVNTEGADRLVELALAALDIDDTSHVLDLYCGAGTFTLPLARRADLVTGVESYGSSIRDLRRNLEEEGLYAEVVGGDVARELPDLGDADAAIIDPPRSGLDVPVVDALCERRLSQLVYVSCNPTTLARDLQMLTRDIYRIRSITPVDLFPQSFHVETVVALATK